MAVNSNAYSTARYLIAGSVMTVRDQTWFTLDDIDARAYLSNSLEPEVESLEAMDVCQKKFSPVEGRKYRLEDKYFPEFSKARGYFNVEYNGNLKVVNQELDENDLEILKKEIDVIELLS